MNIGQWWAVLASKNVIFIVQPCFYTQNTQFPMFCPTVVVGNQSAGRGRSAPPIVGRTLLYIKRRVLASPDTTLLNTKPSPNVDVHEC